MPRNRAGASSPQASNAARTVSAGPSGPACRPARASSASSSSLLSRAPWSATATTSFLATQASANPGSFATPSDARPTATTACSAPRWGTARSARSTASAPAGAEPDRTAASAPTSGREQVALAQVGEEALDLAGEVVGRVEELVAELSDQLVERLLLVEEAPDQGADLIEPVIGARLEMEEHASLAGERAVDDLRVLADHGI